MKIPYCLKISIELYVRENTETTNTSVIIACTTFFRILFEENNNC